MRSKAIIPMIIMIAMTGVLTAGIAQAAPIGVASITENVDNPGRIAVDAQGNLYVTEAAKNLVRKFSSKGGYLASLTVPRPLGIAVDAAGFLYVGSEGEKRVNVYDAALTFVRGIGTDIGKPNSIAVDASGTIYVTDTLRNLVRVYDAEGGSVGFAWGAAFRKPMGVAVNDAANEIYVADVPKLPTANGETDGTRVLVFNKTGVFQRTIGQSVGQQARYTEIVCDKAGTLYVTDSIANVFLFNSVTGAAQGALSGSLNGLHNPKGIAISRNGLVYVASYAGGSIEVFALDGYVTMAVDPLSLTFVATQYAGNPDPQTIVISNTGSGTLNWSATADQDWINLGKQDPVGPKSAGGLAVGVNISTFGVGTHTGTITIDSGFGRKEAVSVTVAVVQPPILSISNGWLTFAARKGTTPATQGITLGVENLNGPVAWSIASDSPSWLTVSPASGTISSAALTAAATVSVNTTGLNVGSYSGLLTVNAPGAIGTGGKITVNLTVTPSTRIKVNTNRPEAKFSLSGPAAYGGSGSAWSVEDAPAGDYTVTFDAIAGHKKPLPQMKSLAADGEVTFTGAYASWQELAAKKNIVVAKGPGAKNDSRISVFKNNGAEAVFDLVALATKSGASVAVGDVDGDGAADLIVGAGSGRNNPATVRVFRAADKAMIAEFTPFGALNGARVSAGDLDGDGKAEVLVSDNIGSIVIYTYANGGMASAGITLQGVAAAVADTAFDGKPEVVTVGKKGVKIYDVDLAKGSASLIASKPRLPGDSVAAGDIDGDGNDEILIAGNLTEKGKVPVFVLEAGGTRERLLSLNRNSVTLAAADLDGDGIAEIIIGTTDESTVLGPTRFDSRRSTVKVFGSDGVLKFAFRAFPDAEDADAKDGINVAVGDLGI